MKATTDRHARAGHLECDDEAAIPTPFPPEVTARLAEGEMPKRTPAWHKRCLCGHPIVVHGTYNERRPCLVRRCLCAEYRPSPAPDEEESEMMPACCRSWVYDPVTHGPTPFTQSGHHPACPKGGDQTPVPLASPLSTAEAEECARVTGLDLDELERLANAATPGLWKRVTYWRTRDDLYWVVTMQNRDSYSLWSHLGYDQDGCNAAFIAASRTAVPALIAALRAAERENAALRGALAWYADEDRYTIERNRLLRSRDPQRLPDITHQSTDAAEDLGERARAALAVSPARR